MKSSSIQGRYIMAFILCLLSLVSQAQDPYFIQTFEDSIPSQNDVREPLSFYIEGQGEWIFYNCFKATNTKYIKDGSAGDLRMVKSGLNGPGDSYVITPVLERGVKKITFDEGRTKKYIDVAVSKDGGETWTTIFQYNKNTQEHNTIDVNDIEVNRVRLSNYNTKNDCDVDNLSVYPCYNDGEEPPMHRTTIWCAPDANDEGADGSEEAPFYSLQKAVNMAEPGDTIYMRAGTYVYDARVNINTCASADKRILLYGYDGRAILDFSAMPYHKHADNPNQGIRLCGSYWHLFHIDICNASDNGLLIERNNNSVTTQAHDNIIEECDFHHNGDTGLQMKNLAAFNYVINCDSYLNCDEDQGDADGFAPKLSVGDGNYFYGCRAWANSDDGWDVFFKKDSGVSDNVSIIIENSISYKNGFLDLQNIAPDGNGNGFKLGSNQGAMNVYLNRCLAICNKAKGFDQNHNAGDIIMNNCTGMTLKNISDKTYSYRIYEEIASGHTVRLVNCIAINDNAATNKIDKNTGKYKEGEDGKYGEYGRFEVDSTMVGIEIQTCEFQAAAPTQFIDITNHEELIAPREANGQISNTTFAQLREGSFLIDAGTSIDSCIYRGIPVAGIDYFGTAPDLGAYESNYDGETNIPRLNQPHTNNAIRLLQTQNGLVIITIDSPTTSQHFLLQVFDVQGHLLGQHPFQGPTTAIHLPHTNGILTFSVTSPNGFSATAKAVVK